jgi:hypothetical protein
MKKALLLLMALSTLFSSGNSQELKKKEKPAEKGWVYFAGGTHRIWYTPSTISVRRHTSPSFDFTLYHVKGKDDGGLRWDEGAPEFGYTVGYYFANKGFGLEYHYDHIKYYARPDQVVHMKGVIDRTTYDKDTALTDDFFELEHSDGGNYAMFNIVKWLPITATKDRKFVLDWLIKGGLGFVNPKTNSTIMGTRRDDKYHLSGYVIGAESGLRFNVFKYFIATTSFKGVFANYNKFLIDGGFGKQKWFSLQFNYMFGAQFPL